MDICVFGLGCVGTVTGACLADMGHNVVGVDVDKFKVDAINKGESPIIEKSLGEIVHAAVQARRLRATTNAAEAVAASELSLVCVGAPSTRDGGLEATHVKRVAAEIGTALKEKDMYHVVAVRSTVLPGTVEGTVAPALTEASGKRCGKDFGVCFHPQFLRKGSAVEDFRHPPKTVIGASDERAAMSLAGLYEDIDAPQFVLSVDVAEMIKYADNCFHALKVVFANEIGALCKSLDLDSHEVMGVLCRDTKMNISPAYLTPGFAYGGSCLPRDLRALVHRARELHLDLPVVANIHRSNDAHIARVLNTVLSFGKRNVAMLGLSFKPGTDDLRESPLVELAERLLGKGCRLSIYDEHVALARLRGANKAYIQQKLPHISELLTNDLDKAVNRSDVVIISVAGARFAEVLRRQGKHKAVVDLVRLFEDDIPKLEAYHGICW